MVCQLMLELLVYLPANGFKMIIVSGDAIEFLRPLTEKVYGIPPEQVMGGSIKAQFQLRDKALDEAPSKAGLLLIWRITVRPSIRLQSSNTHFSGAASCF